MILSVVGLPLDLLRTCIRESEAVCRLIVIPEKVQVIDYRGLLDR